MNYSDLSTEQQMIAETKKYVNNKALDVQSDWNESDSSAGDYIKNKPTLGTAAVLDVASSGDASSSQVVKGDDSRLTDSRDAADVYSWAKAPTKPTYTASEVGAYTKTESDNKYVAKETGKGLSTNDYTTADKNKLADIEAEANKTVVDSVMSDSSTNPLQNKVITKELEGTKTTSGNPLTIEDAAPVNAVNLSVDLEPIQDLHGYDHPWVGGAGKNKLPLILSEIKAANTSGTWSGNVYSINNGTFEILVDSDNNVIGIKVNGNFNTNTGFNLLTSSYATLTSIGLISGTSYIVNGCPQGGSFSNTYSLLFNAGNTSNKFDEGSGLNITVNSTDTYKIQVYIQSGYTANNLIFYPMIRLSTETDSSFAPYTNKASISGRSEVAIQRVGVNQWDEEWESGAILGNTGQNTPSSTKIRSVNYIPIFSGTTYYYKHSSTESDLFFYDENKTYINSISKNTSGTFTTPNNAKYVRFSILQTTYNNNISINYPSTDHDYHAYAGKTYTIQLGQTVYGGQRDVTRGKMVVTHKGVVYDGSSDEGWAKNSSASDNYLYYCNSLTPTHVLNNQTAVTSNLLPTKTTPEVISQIGISLNSEESTIFYANFGNLIGTNDVAHLRTYLASNPLQVVYELAEPFTIDLTPTQIKMLENTNTLYTDYEGDTITIEYQPNNAIGEAVRAVEENYETRVSLLENRNTAKVYGFHISSTESDPAAKVTYLADAVGMTPAHMNFSTGKFDYGSWEDVWFVRDTKPCLLKDNGQIHRYLNKNNFLKDIDGNDTGVPQITIHTMIEFPKIWYKVVPDIDGKGASIYISPVKVDADYVDYPYIDYQGIHKEHFYMPAYNGSTQTESGTTYLCSTYGETVSKSLTAEQEITYCKAHGNGWNTEDAGSIMLINFLLILMGKSTDVQSVFGQGLHTGGTEAINNGFTTGIHYNKGMFYGTNSGTIASNNYSNAVKVFGIENYWGFQWRRYAGDILVDGVRKIKLCYGNEDGSSTFDYNLTGNGYVNVGATPSGTSSGYISEMKFTKNGMYSKVSSGSSSTYYCDGQWFNNSDTRYALRGGYSNTGARCGAFYMALDLAASYAGWDGGVGLEYK